MWDTVGEVRTNSEVMYSSGPLQTDEQRQDDYLEPTYNSSVPIRDVTLTTCRKRWTIEKDGGRRSGRSVPMMMMMMICLVLYCQLFRCYNICPIIPLWSLIKPKLNKWTARVILFFQRWMFEKNQPHFLDELITEEEWTNVPCILQTALFRFWI